MRLAQIILAHKNQDQLMRLINRLSHPCVDCWVHVDKKSTTIDRAALARLKNVYPVQPGIDVKWAGISLLKAMLNSMDAVMNAKSYDYIHFLSGQDYPLLAPELFLDYLEEHKGTEFIGNRPYEESKQNILRFRQYHFPDFSFPGKPAFERMVNTILPERKFPYDFSIRKGPQWMALTTEAVEYILQFVSANPKYLRYFRWVMASDEFFFQTILYNSPFRQRMKNQIFHYIDWSEQKKSPKTLTAKDLNNILRSDLFFARKFDTSVDAAVLDVLDKRILSFSVK